MKMKIEMSDVGCQMSGIFPGEKIGVRSLESKVRHSGFGIWNLNFGIWNFHFGIRLPGNQMENSGFGIWNLNFGFWNFHFGIRLPGSQKRTFFPVIFFLSFFLLSSFSSNAQDVKVSATIDSSSILIGDQIRMQLSATYDPQLFRIQFPSVPDTFNHFEVVERSKIDTLMGREENTYRQTVIVTNFDSGQWKIPPVAFEVQSLKGDPSQTLLSDSFLVNVNTMQVDTTKPIKPIFGIRGAKMPLKQIIFYVIAGILIAIILGLLIWYLWKKRKNKKPVVKEPEIILLPHEKALRELKKINGQQLWQSNREKEYHTVVTDAVRTYLEEQFGMDCFDKTSSEIISQVKKVKALSTSRQSLRRIFETADMVKFAKSKPTPEEHIQSMELAHEFIRESYKKVKPMNNEINSPNHQKIADRS